MYFEDLWNEEFPKMGVTYSNPLFRKFMKTLKNGPFLQPKKCLFVVFVFQSSLYWWMRFAKKLHVRTQFGQFGRPEHHL